MTAGGKKSKRRREQAIMNATGLRPEPAAPSPDSVETKPEEPQTPLDRILALERTGDLFKMPADFDVNTLFRDSYGIYLPEGEKPVLVRLRTSLREAAYLQDLPLHPSQVLESRTEEACIFALYLIPNPNLVMDLCKRGDRLEVLEPASLREAVLQAHKTALQLYES